MVPSLYISHSGDVTTHLGALAGLSSMDVPELAADIQMRMVSEQEDAYWHAHFAQEPYYVAGRGYDQYKPAYELGWCWALQHPDAGFTDFAKELELLWAACSATSLLPWREVHLAVKDAWEHASLQMQKMQQYAPAVWHGRDVAGSLLPLYKGCQSLVNELERMRTAPMDDFAAQVMARHIVLLQSFVQALDPWCEADVQPLRIGQPWLQHLHFQWVKFKFSLSEWAPAQVFEVCEQRERSLLSSYQRVLRKSLPVDVKALLVQQMKGLQCNFDKLCLVRYQQSF